MNATKTSLITEFLTLKRILHYENNATEPEAVAYENFLKIKKIQVSYGFFTRIYNRIHNIKINKYKRMCSILHLRNGTHFSFKKNSRIFVAQRRIVRPINKNDYEFYLDYLGIISDGYFKGHIKHPFSKAQSCLVYLHDIEILNSKVVSESKVIYKK